LWPNGIAEPDVHLQALADRAESSIEHDSDARIFVLRADGLDIELEESNLIPSSSTSVLQMAAISRLTESVSLLPCASRSRSRVDRYG
jgi:hypothetical protein